MKTLNLIENIIILHYAVYLVDIFIRFLSMKRLRDFFYKGFLRS